MARGLGRGVDGMLRFRSRGDVDDQGRPVRVRAPDGTSMSGPDASAGNLTVRGIELREVALPLVRPFRTSFGEERDKRAILVRVLTEQGEGWGECVASTEPRYSDEWLDGAWAVLNRHLGPAVLRNPRVEHPE